MKTAVPLSRLVGVSVLLAVGTIYPGCRPEAPAADPAVTVKRYAVALENGDVAAAYDLLSDEAKRRLPRAAFEQMLKDNPGAVRELAAALKAEALHQTAVAYMTTPDGERLELVWEDGAWRANAAAIDFYSQSTPQSALKTLVRAFEARRFDVLVRLAPRAEREGLTPAELRAAWEGELKDEIQSLVDDLKAALPFAEVEVLGERATVRYGAGARLLMLREDGAWKIEELEGGAESDNSSQDK